ncbi:MAG: NAD(P)-dependent oxidoreductase [Acidobacteriota bacterium]|nr:MAG: NAD(P)-dependent oxidoreductase [Acidobacteriota bacterium]
MRVLLTGASGFIGSHVAELALSEGHEVMALVRRGSSLHRLEGIRDRLRLLEGDLLDAAALEAPLRASVPEVCLHLAWYAKPGQYLRAHENLDCLKGSLTFMHILHQIGCQRLVIAGTSLEYESSTSAVAETSPIHPTTLYAAAKHSLFLAASTFDVHGEWSVASARIFCVYGPWEDPRRLVPGVISNLLAGEICELSHGEQIRDYSHVEDVASALWAIAKSSAVGPINIGSSRPVTVAAIAEQIGEILGRLELLDFGARPLSPGDPPFLVANTDRLGNELGWQPRYDLASGLAHVVNWCRSQIGR